MISLSFKRKTMQAKNITPSEKASKKEKINLEHQRDKDREMVKGIFRFHEVPGGSMSFIYAAYKGDQPERYDLFDGEQYTIPLGVARHLNKNCWYPVHTFAQDEGGRHGYKVGQKIRRCSFQSLEFVDIDDLTPEGSSLVTVERVTHSVSI